MFVDHTLNISKAVPRTIMTTAFAIISKTLVPFHVVPSSFKDCLNDLYVDTKNWIGDCTQGPVTSVIR